VKALYRRAKAGVKVWRVEEARQDYQRVMELDPSLANSVRNELKQLEKDVRLKDEEEKRKLQGKLFS